MYQRAVDVSPEMALAVIHALKKDGFSTVVAPYEADAQMAYLVRHGFVDGVVTEDSDLVPHRCASVFFKMDNDGMGQEIRYADVTANRDLSFAGFTPDQFLEMCVMSGCDYLPSLPGVGIKKAHALMRRFKRHDAALRSLRFEGTPVPRKYEQGFKDALSVFKHQWVFCPVRGEMAHLSSAPPAREENARASDGATRTTRTTRRSRARGRGASHRAEAPRGRGARRRGGRAPPHDPRGVRAAAHRGRACPGPKRERRELLSPARRGGAVQRRAAVAGAAAGAPARAETLAALSTPRTGRGLTPRSAGTEPRTKPKPSARTEPPRAPERWVTPPALTAANPGKRAFYALLRASPPARAAESPLESRFGEGHKVKDAGDTKRLRGFLTRVEGPRDGDARVADDVADADEAAATRAARRAGTRRTRFT